MESFSTTSEHFRYFELNCLKTCFYVLMHILSDYDWYLKTIYFHIRVILKNSGFKITCEQNSRNQIVKIYMNSHEISLMTLSP